MDEMRDVYEMFVYLILIIVSSIVMVAWLKRRSRKKKR